jgi:hypothetical protein
MCREEREPQGFTGGQRLAPVSRRMSTSDLPEAFSGWVQLRVFHTRRPCRL